MITADAIYKYLTYLVEEALSDHHMLNDFGKGIIYSPNLTWDADLRKHIVKDDIVFYADTSTSNWIGTLWNREPIRKSDLQGQREFKAMIKEGARLPNPVAKGYNARMIDLSMQLLLVSPSLYILEAVEEQLVTTEQRVALTIDYGDPIGELDMDVKEFEVNSITKEDKATYGTVATMGVTVMLNYYVMVPSEDVPLIGIINVDIYTVYGDKIGTVEVY